MTPYLALQNEFDAQRRRINALENERECLRTALQAFAKMYAAPGGDLDKAIEAAKRALGWGKL